MGQKPYCSSAGQVGSNSNSNRTWLVGRSLRCNDRETPQKIHGNPCNVACKIILTGTSINSLDTGMDDGGFQRYFFVIVTQGTRLDAHMKFDMFPQQLDINGYIHSTRHLAPTYIYTVTGFNKAATTEERLGFRRKW